MGATPQYVGMYGKPWTINLNTDSGTDNIGAATSISVAIRNGNNSNVSTGQITVLSNNPAQILWQPTSTDYANAGNVELVVTANYTTGPYEYDPIPFTIKAY